MTVMIFHALSGNATFLLEPLDVVVRANTEPIRCSYVLFILAICFFTVDQFRADLPLLAGAMRAKTNNENNIQKSVLIVMIYILCRFFLFVGLQFCAIELNNSLFSIIWPVREFISERLVGSLHCTILH